MNVMTDDGNTRPTNKFSVSFLLHNVFIHPIAGIFWFLGLGEIGNKIHECFRPKE